MLHRGGHAEREREHLQYVDFTSESLSAASRERSSIPPIQDSVSEDGLPLHLLDIARSVKAACVEIAGAVEIARDGFLDPSHRYDPNSARRAYR